jgi:Sec7-like guanine-nucleotide exchange factor
MAGIDSQVVFRILEHFSKVYYQKDSTTFVSQEEAYEFAYLIIVLQTCQHNPSIKEKTSLERFVGQAQAIVPKSFNTLPPGFVEDVFNKVTSNEIKAPVTRDLIKGAFQSQIVDDVKMRLIGSSG